MITIKTLNQLKQEGEKICALTSYDASFAAIAEESGVEVILVGDSLGMVVQGHDSTVPVTIDDLVYHTANVKRGAYNAFVIADMPFMSDVSPKTALLNAGRLMQEGGAQMVKLEGGTNKLEIVKHLTSYGVPVCGHLGLLPQSIHQIGSYQVQGKDPHQAEAILEAAVALEQAGVQMLVLECVPSQLANEITLQLSIPVIGIGAGVDVDGQVLVVYDMLGLSDINSPPRFVRNFLQDQNSIQSAIASYVNAVKTEQYPTEEESY